MRAGLFTALITDDTQLNGIFEKLLQSHFGCMYAAAQSACAVRQ
jgi:hypothetical protein